MKVTIEYDPLSYLHENKETINRLINHDRAYCTIEEILEYLRKLNKYDSDKIGKATGLEVLEQITEQVYEILEINKIEV